MLYDWPGNIRELKNCTDRMMAFNSGPVLHYADLPTGVAGHGQMMYKTMAAGVRGGTLAPPPPGLRALSYVTTHGVLPLQQVERRAIEEALTYTRGDRTTAAHLLGIGRTTLYRKLKEYGYTTAVHAGDVPPDFTPAA